MKQKHIYNLTLFSGLFMAGFLSGFCQTFIFGWLVTLLAFATLFCALRHMATLCGAMIAGLVFASGLVMGAYDWGFRATFFFLEHIWPDDTGINIAIATGLFMAFFLVYVLASGLCASVVWYLRQRLLWASLVFAGLFTAVETLQGVPFETGFSWGLSGMAAVSLLPFAQLAAVGSVYLVGGILVLCAALLGSGHRGFQYAAFFLFLGCVSWGGVRISPEIQVVQTTPYYLVQADIPQKQKLDASFIGQHFSTYYSVTDSLSAGETEAIFFWPETAIRGDYSNNTGMQQAMARLTARGSVIVTGVEQKTSDVAWQNNAALFLADQKKPVSVSKKIAVPFFEMVPFPVLLKPLYDRYFPFVTAVQTRQNGEGVLPVAGLGRAGVLNCYEVAFPFYAAKIADKSDFILHMTNDAWFFSDRAKRQSLNLARLRAIETGRPVIRIANAGYNAVIDVYGRAVFLEEPSQTMLPQKQTFLPEKRQTVWQSFFIQ